MATRRKLRILTVVDTFSRYAPVLDPRYSYRGEDVVATLERICARTGYPKTIRVDNCSDFVSRDMDLWAYRHCVTLDFLRPSKPTDNAVIEAFNSKLRSECLNAHWFRSIQANCEKREAWRRHYNEERPHSGIENMPPITLAKSVGETSSPIYWGQVQYHYTATSDLTKIEDVFGDHITIRGKHRRYLR